MVLRDSCTPAAMEISASLSAGPPWAQGLSCLHGWLGGVNFCEGADSPTCQPCLRASPLGASSTQRTG